MRPNTSVKFSLFLIFLTLGQEFSSAYRLYQHSQHRWSADTFKQPEFQEPKFSEPLPYGEDFKGFENKRSENGTGVEVVNRQKRWAAAVALGAGVAISLAGISFEVYLKLATCCGPYPEICTYIDEFKAVQKRLKPMFPKVDFLALTAKNTLEDITQTNYRLIEIWNDMKRIRDLKIKLLEKISSSTIKSFNTKWAEIEAQLRKANNTVRALTYAELSHEFGSFLDSYKSALLGFTPLFVSSLTLAAIPAYNAYKKASLNKEIARLSTGQDYKQLVTARHGKASKILGVQNLNQHIKATATSRNNARFATGKYTQYAVNGISAVSVLISLGVEIYAAYKKLEQCRDKVRADAKKGRDDIVKGEKLLNGTYKNLTGYMTMIDEKGVKYLKGELSSQNVLVELEAIRKLAKGAGQNAQSKNLTIAAQSIDAFIVGIQDSNARQTLKLSAGLADGLARVKFLYTCFDAKVSLVNYCVDHCRNGTGTLPNIYASAAKHFDTKGKECRDDVGVPYYSLADVQFTMNKKAAKENFSSDCLLNNNAKRDEVCRLWDVDRYEKPAIKSKLGLSLAQIDIFISKCLPHKLSPSEKRNICFYRSFGATDQQIYDRKILPRSVTLAQIKAVTCPQP